MNDENKIMHHLEDIAGFRYIAKDIAKMARYGKYPDVDVQEYLWQLARSISEIQKTDFEYTRKIVNWVFLENED